MKHSFTGRMNIKEICDAIKGCGGKGNLLTGIIVQPILNSSLEPVKSRRYPKE